MTVEIKVPTLPESVADATVAKWYKSAGDTIARDENLVDLETDKVMLEVPAPKSGTIDKILVEEGAIVTADQLLAVITEGEVPASTNQVDVEGSSSSAEPVQVTAGNQAAGPAARRAAGEYGVDLNAVSGTGKAGRVTPQDVNRYATTQDSNQIATPSVAEGSRGEKRVPMSRLRQRIAERLLQVQSDAALLTSFNEINMQPVMSLRKEYRDQFEKEHGTRLGFMSFFTKAVIAALQRFPVVNASLDGNDVVYHNYYDIGIAIGSERGLVVPILRNAELLSMADIERAIRDYAAKAKSGKIAIEDIQGGTFTITNGGTYGSMMSTPIINPPQSAILGMHNIVDRPVVENGEIVVRPMMYVALTYDHRLIDGREAVSFLVTIKQMLEEPARMLLQV